MCLSAVGSPGELVSLADQVFVSELGSAGVQN